MVGLTPVAHKRAGRFSLGMGQRLGIAAALYVSRDFRGMEKSFAGHLHV